MANTARQLIGMPQHTITKALLNAAEGTARLATPRG